MAYRGCTSDSKISEGKKFCDKNAKQCVKCADRNCNKDEVQWEKQLSCIICNSTEDENCKSGSDGDRNVCARTTKGYENHCFTRVDNHTVARGCLVDSDPDTVTDCNSWYSQTCTFCNDDYCNQVPIDDEYCFECSTALDSNCTNNVSSYMRKECTKNLIENGCFRISESDDDTSIRRGCASELNATEVVMCHMDEQRFCKLCMGNDCNQKPAPQTCYICSSANDSNCVGNANASMAAECLNYVDECITLIDSMDNDAVVRNCLRNVYMDDTFCRNNPSMCSTCEGDNCNSQPVIDNQTCYTCDSALDPNCHSNLGNDMITKCSLSANNLGCYHSIDESGKSWSPTNFDFFFNFSQFSIDFVSGSSVRRGCLSDLSPVEYTECNSNPKSCKTCHGLNCNNLNAIQKCYQCNSTEDVDCIRAVGWFTPVTCQTYGDQCYVHVANDVVTRGCLLESKNVKLKAECNDPDMCEKCTGKAGCNDKIVGGEFCMTCDSNADANCRKNLTIALRTQCSLAVKPMGCYRWEDEGDSVKRGCVSDIRPDERQMCRKQGNTCKTCFGDDCNKRISFRTCHVCNSTTSKSCIRGPSQFPVVMCHDYLDECFTHVRNDVVTRGCLRQTPNLIKDCDDEDLCVKCTDKAGCNKKIVDGEFCLTCDSMINPNCRKNVTFGMRTQCTLAVRPLGCYRFEDEGGLVKRGCLSDIQPDEREMCREEDVNCKTCVGNDCNAKITFQQCRVCNSTESVNCIRAPSLFPVVTCRNYADECFTHVRNDVVVRGCVAESESAVIEQDCRKNRVNTDYCDRCADGKCNNHTVDGEFCMTCDSELDPNCRNNLTFEMRTQCTLAVRPMGCYRFEDHGNLVKRGCMADVRADEREMCRQQDAACKTCYGDDCNKKIAFQRCVACRSTSNDTACESNAGLLVNRLCKHYLDNCFTHVRNNVTTRGCLLEQKNDLTGVDFQKDCTDPDLCEKCDNQDSCNVSPVSIETCGIQDAPDHPFQSAQCPKAVKTLGCYRAVDIFTGISTRGCVNQLSSPKRRVCREQGDSCKTCQSTSPEEVCNALDSFVQCYGCDSASNPNCAIAPTDGMKRTCGNYNDTCFTSRATDGQVRRGCLKEMSAQFISACKGNEKNCNVCAGGGCNNRSVGIERCIECDSSVDPNCVNQLHLFGDGKVCNANDPMRWQGCYLSVKNGHVNRGCVSDIVDLAQKQTCLDGSDTCKVCNGRNCNRKETYQSCYACNSRTDEQCSRVNASATVLCRNYLDTCVVSLQRDGHMRRGCGEQFTPAELAADSQFSRCPGDNCNGHIYPADRLLCHHCNGTDNCQYLEGVINPSTLRPCPRYVQNDGCFSLLQTRK